MSGAIIRAGHGVPRPWKNGLGTTRELAVHPADASSDDFLWRISIAEVDSAAPFSRFPGIDRHIVLLDGAGFGMTLDEGRQHALTAPFAPFAFPGEAGVAVTLIAGPTRDFNLMVRRTQARGTVTVWQHAGSRSLAPDCVLVYAARGEIDTDDGRLQAGDAWRPMAPTAGDLALRDGAVALVVHVAPLA
ncbi:MAG: HutD family protein [Rhodanobacter sp.]|jgi:environmental stress-induced protein Ves|nr:HutD family protein [Rhodanobacter sp.]